MTFRHLSWLSVQMCTAGCMASGLSKLAMVISRLELPATVNLAYAEETVQSSDNLAREALLPLPLPKSLFPSQAVLTQRSAIWRGEKINLARYASCKSLPVYQDHCHAMEYPLAQQLTPVLEEHLGATPAAELPQACL